MHHVLECPSSINKFVHGGRRVEKFGFQRHILLYCLKRHLNLLVMLLSPVFEF